MLLIIRLLLLSLVVHEAQGARLLRKGSQPSIQHSISHKALSEMTKEDIVEEVDSLWHFTGRARKLMKTSPIPTTTTVAKLDLVGVQNENDKNIEENLSVDSSSTAEQRRPVAGETYPDLLGIVGMDYSQARRKPPIHN